MATPPPIPRPGEYDIDIVFGFVSPKSTELPDYYDPWTRLAIHLPTLLGNQMLRQKVDQLETLHTDRLATLQHWQRAYVLLGFLTQAYIWEDKARPASTVPASLGDPFIRVCEHLGMEAVLSYAGGNLWNWLPGRLHRSDGLNPSFADFEKLRSCVTFTGTRDEDAFNLVPVMVEARGGRLIKLLLDAIIADRAGEPVDLEAVLETCVSTFTDMAATLAVLHRECDPQFFYQQIRPMLGGSAGAEHKGLPTGVVLMRVDGSSVAVKCVGASAAQSSLFQFLDHMFGIKHESKALIQMRWYMPEKHRQFLEVVEQLPSLRDVMEQQSENSSLQESFRLAVDALRSWRTKHVAVVSRYVMMPGAAETKGKMAVEARGTAGSLPLPFLKRYRDETIVLDED